MKYGLNLLLWTSTVGPETRPLLEQIKGWGYDGVELPVFELDVPTYEAVGKDLSELGLGCTAVTVSTAEENPISPDAAVRAKAVDRLKLAVDCVAAAGGTKLLGPIHSALGEFSGTGRTEDEWNWCKDVLSEVADHAQKNDIILVCEYLNRFECYFLNCAEDDVKFCREVNHPNLKMMYDTFHANIEEKNIAEAIKTCADKLVHVHISENDRSTPGEGNVDWETSFKTLKEVGYGSDADDYLMIEAFGLALPELAAATRIWRRMFPSEEHLATEGLKFMKQHWEG